MKFGRYLRDTQTSEWRDAYIDYRGLKKQIALIRASREEDRQLDYLDIGHISARQNFSLPGTPSLTYVKDSIPTMGPRLGSSVHFRPSLDHESEKGGIAPLGMPYSKRSRRHSLRSFIRGGAEQPSIVIPLYIVRQHLSPEESNFLSQLDRERDKIESFYLGREDEMTKRTAALSDQLNELIRHRQRSFPAYNQTTFWLAKLKEAVNLSNDEKKQSSPFFPQNVQNVPPVEYQRAKRQLKKAMLVHYRALETLNNYRILNYTGIKKALKKFEKVTQIVIMQAYLTEHVKTTSFATSTAVTEMMKRMEDLFSEHFCNGDNRKAMDLLRASELGRSYYTSSFLSGIYLGLALPALMFGLYLSLQPYTRDKIKYWDYLLLIYGTFAIPTFFSLLICGNIIAWTKARINYVFIFGIDTRSRLDFRQYSELPSLIFCMLCYSFWLSFAQIGSPAAWPVVWQCLTLLILINPLRIGARSSRFWLIRKIGRLLTSGASKVQFTDFWLGDQLCSFTYTLGNLPLIVSLYASNFQTSSKSYSEPTVVWACGAGLACSPFFLRLLQSLRRYADTGSISHLVNGGKYAVGFVTYLIYFMWRFRDQNSKQSPFFIIWCILSTFHTTYAAAWDLLVDWSIFGLRGPHKPLRAGLLYRSHVSLYYFAIITNILTRFTWVIYIPHLGGITFVTRTFIVGFTEMIRRWQWNFYRLENEHLGNMDQYRITREVPLPYTFSEPATYNESDD